MVASCEGCPCVSTTAGGGLPVKGVDIVHGLDCVVPSWGRVKRLVTFHDLLMLSSDDVQIAPEGFRHKKRQIYQAAAADADAIITVSRTTKQDVVQLLAVPETRVYVTHLGIDPAFWAANARSHWPRTQALCAGSRISAFHWGDIWTQKYRETSAGLCAITRQQGASFGTRRSHVVPQRGYACRHAAMWT